jgi:hypothetical protein
MFIVRLAGSPPQRKLWRDFSNEGMGNRAKARLIRQELLNSVMGKTADHRTVQAIPHTTLHFECAAQIGA